MDFSVYGIKIGMEFTYTEMYRFLHSIGKCDSQSKFVDNYGFHNWIVTGFSETGEKVKMKVGRRAITGNAELLGKYFDKPNLKLLLCLNF